MILIVKINALHYLNEKRNSRNILQFTYFYLFFIYKLLTFNPVFGKTNNAYLLKLIQIKPILTQ